MIDREAMASDLQALVATPSVTGDESAAQEAVTAIARRLGLEVEHVVDRVDELSAMVGFPGMEVARTDVHTVVARLPGADPQAPRLCVNGHVDVVPPGSSAWTHGPWSGHRAGDRVFGRGAVDMKGGVVAALHAMAAIREVHGAAPGEVVLQCVSGEEDGGVGTFAALRRDARFDACVIPEPTGLDLVCAQAGALTFKGRVRGRSAHAAFRLQGVSAIDRYVRLHAAMAEHERRVNEEPGHPLMAAIDLAYPLVVGRVSAGEWSSTVPDELEFEGRLGVRVGQSIEEARSQFEVAIRKATADDDGPPVEIGWDGGQFGSGAVDVDHPFVALARREIAAVLGRQPRLTGVPYGADMRQFAERGIPCVMFGPRGEPHVVDESVSIDDLAVVARAIANIALAFGRG